MSKFEKFIEPENVWEYFFSNYDKFNDVDVVAAQIESDSKVVVEVLIGAEDYIPCIYLMVSSNLVMKEKVCSEKECNEIVKRFYDSASAYADRVLDDVESNNGHEEYDDIVEVGAFNSNGDSEIADIMVENGCTIIYRAATDDEIVEADDRECEIITAVDDMLDILLSEDGCPYDGALTSDFVDVIESVLVESYGILLRRPRVEELNGQMFISEFKFRD